MKKRRNSLFVGRYGNDHLGLLLSLFAILFYLLFLFTKILFLALLSFLCWAVSIFRMYSKNIPARQRENQKYLQHSAPYLDKLNLFFLTKKDKTHRYFSCPTCKQRLRVPKGKGLIELRCSRCQTTFRGKS